MTGWEPFWRFLAAFAPLIFFVTLGGVGNYFALPKGRRTREQLGKTLGCIALLSTPGLLIGAQVEIPERILFLLFMVLAFVGAGSMVTRSNPVHGALFFALVLLATCGLFLLQGAPFLMAATMIIYAGAIVVTFLFVIMLAQQEGMTTANHLSREPFLASLTTTVLLAALGIVLFRTYDTMPLDALLARVDEASKATGQADIDRILGGPMQFSEAFDQIIGDPPREAKDRRALAYLALADAVENSRKHWARANTELLKAELGKVHDACLQVRAMQGALQAPPGLPVSKQTGSPAGEAPQPLPAANVAALGKALFTDYLIAVELAGMLLLVAAIGALAIAGRRAEGVK